MTSGNTAAKNTGRRGKRILLTVSGALLGLIVVVAATLALMDDDDYRAALIWAVEKFTDNQLQIDGPFSIDFGKNVQLSAEAVRLKADDGSYDLSVGKFHGSQRFGSYLRTGTMWINGLTLADVKLDITESDSDQEFDLEDLSVPPVVIENVDVKDLALTYRESGKDTAHTISLSRLAIDDAQDQGPITISGAGVVNKQAFHIKGTLGSLEQLQDSSAPYPVDLNVTSGTFNAGIKGTIADPVTGKGLALKLHVRDPDISQTLKTLDPTIPALGELDFAAQLGGNYSAPRLADVKLLLQDADKLELLVRGKVDNLARMKGAQFDASLKAPGLALLAGWLDTELPALGPVDISGNFTGTERKQEFSEVKLLVGKGDNPAVKVTGSAHTSLPESGRMQATFEVATAALAEILDDDIKADIQLDALGYLQGDVTISHLNDSWEIENIKLDSDRTTLYQLHVDGTGVGFKEHDKARLQTRLEVEDPPALGTALGINLHGIAALKMQGELSGGKDRITYQGETTVGRTDGHLDLTALLGKTRPLLRGKLNVPILYLADIGITRLLPEEENTKTRERAEAHEQDETEDETRASPKSGEKPTTGDPNLFDRTPIDFSALQALDVDFSLSVDKIAEAKTSIGEMKGQVNLENGVLRVSPMHLVLEGGKTEFDMELDTRDTPKLVLKAKAEDLMLGTMIAELQTMVPIKGSANVDIDITASGKSAHELASTLSGKVSLALEDALIRKRYVQMLSVDVFGWALGAATFENRFARLNCVITGFDIDLGIADSTILLADGPNLSIDGHAKLDLGKETMDIVVLPKKKKHFFGKMSPVKIKGPMADPKVEAMPVKAAATEIGTTVLTSGALMPVMLVGKIFSRLKIGERKAPAALK